MNLVVIGEAAKRLGPAALAQAHGIPWRQVAALRDRIAHGYRSLDWATIWVIASEEMAPLLSAVTPLLPNEGPP
jgi:uncharacterized protein with HEPN domain